MKVQCEDCRDEAAANYLYTECMHLLCEKCALLKWDYSFSLKCCRKTTYLDTQACTSLTNYEARTRPSQPDEFKENIGSRGSHEDSLGPSSKNPSERNDSIYFSSLKKDLYQRECDRRDEVIEERTLDREQPQVGEVKAIELDMMLAASVETVRKQFDVYHKQLYDKEEKIIRDLYTRLARQIEQLGNDLTLSDTQKISASLAQVCEQASAHNLQLNSQHVQLSSQHVQLNPQQVHAAEAKSDKILEKLQYNQQKMKEKLDRHYKLLK